jgi:plasmid stability protein
MDTTIRNLDEQAYRAIRARAVIEGRPVGELITEAIRGYIARTAVRQASVSLRDLKPERFPDGNENLSSEIDVVVYGTRR